MLATAAIKRAAKVEIALLLPRRGAMRCEPDMVCLEVWAVSYPCSSRNFVTSGDQIGMASGEPMKKCPSLPNGGTRRYSALPPDAVNASCMRLDRAGPKKVSFSI